MPATSEPKSGSVTATAAMISPVASLGSHSLLLRLGAALDQRPGQDLGPGDERAADAQRSPRQLLGGHHHPEVVVLAAAGPAAVLLGHGQAERAHLTQPGDELLGHVAVGAVHVLGCRCDLLLGEAAERVLDQFEVGVEMAGAVDGGQLGDELRIAVGRQERQRVRPAHRARRPTPFPGRRCGPMRSWTTSATKAHQSVASRSPFRPVVEHRAGGGDTGGGVSQVVGEDLGVVRPPGRRQALPAGGDDAGREVDDASGRGEIRGRRCRGHGAER